MLISDLRVGYRDYTGTHLSESSFDAEKYESKLFIHSEK